MGLTTLSQSHMGNHKPTPTVRVGQMNSSCPIHRFFNCALEGRIQRLMAIWRFVCIMKELAYRHKSEFQLDIFSKCPEAIQRRLNQKTWFQGHILDLT